MIWYIWRMIWWRNGITMKHFLTLNSSYKLNYLISAHPSNFISFQLTSKLKSLEFKNSFTFFIQKYIYIYIFSVRNFIVNQRYHHYIKQSRIKSGNEVVQYWTCALYNHVQQLILCVEGSYYLRRTLRSSNISKRHSNVVVFSYFLSLILEGILAFSGHGSFISFI